MELTRDVPTDIVSGEDTHDLPVLDDSHLHQDRAEQIPPKPTDPPPKDGTSEAPVTDGADIDALPIVVFCRSFLERLEKEPELPADERRALMAQALGDLLGDLVLNDLALGEVAQALYDADTEAYEAWSNNQFKRGLVLAVSTLGLSGRPASNIIALFRPQLLHELDIDSGVETVMLDTALGALCDHAAATAEVRRVTRSGEGRSLKVAAQHARIMSVAQPLLRVFHTTVERLRKKKQVRSLNIQAAGDVAVQVNEAGSPPATRAKDDIVLVAEMELPPAGAPEAAPDPALEAA